MGKKTKTGKERKDEYYYKAKASGYRARAAFKLLEINQKFNFLEKSTILIDLCAAPGSWLQVASKIMPSASIKIGIDLDYIDPIPGCKTFVADITSDKCRQLIRDEIKTAKANVVLHDGAPNVGGNWNLDEFQQAHLCLKAFTLATEFLVKNGTFVTKVFRSKDFESLRWVFLQLFNKVHIVKPKSSRTQSAEIFLVCEKFKAPIHLDPMFLDIKHVFADVNDEKELTYKMAQKLTKKANGYDGPMIKNMTVSELLEHHIPTNVLLTYNKIIFDNEEIENHELTTDNVKRCFDNLQWVSKHDFDKLKAWLKKMIPIYKKLKNDDQELSNNEEDTEKLDEDESESDNDEQLDKQMAEIENEMKKSARQDIKKERKKKLKYIKLIQNQMLHPGDRIDQSADIDMFSSNKDYYQLFKDGKMDFEMNLEDLDEMLSNEFRQKRQNEIQKYREDRKLIGPRQKFLDKTIPDNHDYGLEVDYEDPNEINDVENDSDDEEQEELEYSSEDDEEYESDSGSDGEELEEGKNIRSKNKVKFMDREKFIDLLCGIENSEVDNEEDEVEDVEDLQIEKPKKRTHSEMEDDGEEKLEYANKLYTYIMQMATNTEKRRIKSIVEDGSIEQREALLEYAHRKHVAFVDPMTPQELIEEEKKFNRRPIPLDDIENAGDDNEPKAKKQKTARVKNKVDKSQSKKVLQAKNRRKKRTTSALNRLAKKSDKELTEMTDMDTSRYMEKLAKKVNKIKSNRRHVVFNVVKNGGVTANSKNKLKGRAKQGAKVVFVDKRSKSDIRKKKKTCFKSNVNKRKSKSK